MNGDMRRQLGAQVRAVRMSRGLTQMGLAESINKHRTYVGAIERGERNPSLKVVEELADLLDFDVALQFGSRSPDRTE